MGVWEAGGRTPAFREHLLGAPPPTPAPTRTGLLTEVKAAVPTDKLEGVHQLPAAQGLTGAVSSKAARGQGQEGEQHQHRLPHWDPHRHLGAETGGHEPSPGLEATPAAPPGRGLWETPARPPPDSKFGSGFRSPCPKRGRSNGQKERVLSCPGGVRSRPRFERMCVKHVFDGHQVSRGDDRPRRHHRRGSATPQSRRGQGWTLNLASVL